MTPPPQVDPHLATYIAPPESASDAAQIKVALDSTVSSNAKPMSLGLAILYSVLTVMHWLVQQDLRVAVPMTAMAAVSALGLWGLHLCLRRWPVPARWGNWIGAGMALVVLGNSLAHMGLAIDLQLTSNVSILLIGIGAYFLRWRWFASVVTITIIGWSIVIWGILASPIPIEDDIVHYIVWQGESILVATVLFVTRSHLVKRLARLHLQDERQKAELAEAIRVAEQNRAVAEAASQAKSAFLANMSHEMRTPLTAILGYNDLMQMQVEASNALHSDLQKVRQAGIHLLVLIENLLDLSKIEAGHATLQLETFALPALIDEVVDTTRPLVMKHNNTLYTRLAADLRPMHADQTWLRQILLNLISNAAKFTEHGTITLVVWMELLTYPDADDGAEERVWTVFQVCDTGIGLRPEQIDQLFVAFQQGDTGKLHRYGGAGLGLALSRRLCELMGGTITATGEPGQGATFTVYIPAHVSPVLEASSPAT